MRCWLANKKLHKLNFAKSSNSECHLQTLLPYYAHTRTHTHTLAHMPAICDALKLANICLPAFCCCLVFLPTRSWWRRPPFCCSSVACLVTASLALLLLSSPLRLPLPGVSFVHACHARKKRKGGRAPKQRVSKQQAQQKQLLKRSYR